MALALGEQSARLGLHEDAARLMDLSGDDTRLAEYLNDYIHNNGTSNDSRKGSQTGPITEDLIQTEPDDDQGGGGGGGGEAAAAERLRALRAARETGGGNGVGVAPAAGERAACAVELFRRSSLLAGVSRIPQVGSVS